MNNIKSNELVSVIVPVYNVSKYVEKCIDSILDQTYENIEIIIVNDGSTDNSLELITKRYSQNEKIRIISQENKGLSGARNTGIKNSSGKYLCFVDSDDWISPQFVELLYSSVTKHNADIAVCNIEYVFDDGKILKNPKIQNADIFDKEKAIHSLIIRKPFGSHPVNKIYKTKLFIGNDIYYPERKVCEDVYTTYRLFLKSKRISVIPDTLYFYLQQRPGSILNSKFKIERITDVIEAYNCFYKDTNKEFPSRDNSDFVIWKIDLILMFYTVVAEHIKDMKADEFKYAVDLIRDEAKSIQINGLEVSLSRRIRLSFAGIAPRAYCRTLVLAKKIRNILRE